VVFAGHGVSAPDKGWDDYAGLDVRGKIVLVLPNEPDFLSESGPFGGRRMSYHARLGTKVEEAGRRGAAGVLALFDPESAEYGWPLIQRTFGQPTNGVPGADLSLVRFTGYLGEAASKRLLACAGRDFDAEKAKAATAEFRASALVGVKLSAAFNVGVESKITHNVVAKFPGTQRADEYFLYTAHWDHLGRGKPDSTGDDIYNGALDNAGGTAGLLALARAFGRAPRTQRSIMFIAMTLEESGLLGSEYFAANPLVPLEKVAGGFNMDAVNLIGATKTMEVTSMGQTTLEDHLKLELAA
jgi:Zn-dependent M28 family amino/carboxypeptidase